MKSSKLWIIVNWDVQNAHSPTCFDWAKLREERGGSWKNSGKTHPEIKNNFPQKKKAVVCPVGRFIGLLKFFTTGKLERRPLWGLIIISNSLYVGVLSCCTGNAKYAACALKALWTEVSGYQLQQLRFCRMTCWNARTGVLLCCSC